MATPTPFSAIPSPASKKTVHNNVSTPSAHNLSSPAPRSVPSPATTRKDLSGKTPAAHSTGSKTIGSTPMVPNLSQQGSMASPGIGMTPTGLGVDLGTPGLTTPAMAAGMVPTMSELGLSASSLKRNEDEERRAKMRKILKTIGRPKGRISEEGIARVSRRVGFANDIDAEKLSHEERERRVGNRTISIAGNTMVIDVELKNHVPQGVQVNFQNEMSNKDGQAERAGKILFDNLAPPNRTINTMLDKFAVNLERLARLDRLSTKVNCFDALSGIYASLKKLYDQEQKLAKHLQARPALHEDGALGLCLTYRDKHKIWLETERCPASIYPCIRISSEWFGDMEPAPTYLDDDTLPDIRFVAKLDPPVVLPWQVAANLFQLVGSTIPPAFQLPTYMSLLLDQTLTSETLVTKGTVLRPDGDELVDAEHIYRISVAKHDAGFRLEELPFSHPRQILEVLPVLRQWLKLSEILQELNARHPIGSTGQPLRLGSVLDNGVEVTGGLIVDVTIVTSPTPVVCLAFLLETSEICAADVQILPNGELHIEGGLLPNADKALAVCDVGTWVEWVRTKKVAVNA